MNTSTITVADSNAFMADLRGAAYAAKHDPKIIAELKELKELSRRLARAGETVMHPVQRILHRRAVRCRSILLARELAQIVVDECLVTRSVKGGLC
jgi:hypothetical protein